MVSEKRLRGVIERYPRPPEPLRRARKRFRSKSEFRKGLAACPHPRPLKSLIAITRIFGPAKARRGQRGGKPRLGHVEQGSQHGDAGPGARFRNRGKTVKPAAALQAHEESLGLIVEMVRGDEPRNVMSMAIGGHEVVAGFSRALLQTSALRLDSPPGENHMRQAKALRHPRHHCRFLARFGAEPVIDRQYREVRLRPAFGAPPRHEVEQRRAVGATRHRQRKPGETRQGREGRSRLAR
jgi:hypothetical protein